MHLSDRTNNLRMVRVYYESLVQSSKSLALASFTLRS